MSYNAAEAETIGLCVALEAINDMANHALLEILEVSTYPGEAEVRYKSHVHQQLFLIRLLDFAKECGDQTLTGVRGSCLEVLLAASRSKAFDSNGSANALGLAVNDLQNWLNSKTTLKLWLPTLEINVKLTVARIEFLFILANHVKHNLSRLTSVSRRIQEILADHGHSVQLEQVPLALDDFREHLQDDYFVYYGTWLAELINNVRWGIQDYLMPTFQQSYERIPGKENGYRYSFPDSISHEVPRAWFCRLMNLVSCEPYFKRFLGAHYMKREVLHTQE